MQEHNDPGAGTLCTSATGRVAAVQGEKPAIVEFSVVAAPDSRVAHVADSGRITADAVGLRAVPLCDRPVMRGAFVLRDVVIPHFTYGPSPLWSEWCRRCVFNATLAVPATQDGGDQ